MERSDTTRHQEAAISDKESPLHLEKTQTEDAEDHIAVEAIGGESSEQMPPHYYRSPAFIGTFLVSHALLLLTCPDRGCN